MIPRFNNLEWALILITGFLTGCAYAWKETERVDDAAVRKIETDIAPSFCSALLGYPARACTVRLKVDDVMRCVTVMMPGDIYAVRHEVGGHCMGQDH